MGWNYLSIPKLQRCNRWSLGMDKLFHPTVYNVCNYGSMLGLKLNHVSKRGPWGTIACVRNVECLTFNHHLDSATCILLPTAGCMALDGRHGYHYIHLSDCHMVPVKEIRRPPDGGWRWVRRDSPASRNDLIKLPGQRIHYAGRVFIDGSYRPGLGATNAILG